MKLLKGHISPEMLRGCRVEEQGKVCHSSQGMGGNVFVLFCFFDKLSPTFSLDHKQKVVFLSISTCRNLTTYNKTGNMEHTYKRKKREREKRPLQHYVSTPFSEYLLSLRVFGII